MAVAYLSLGSNIGDRLANLDSALSMLVKTDGVWLGPMSAVYETAPVGGVEQDSFYNMVAQIETTLSPRELLLLIHDIEASLGRTRDVRWGPRTIDIDILLYDNVTVEEEDLVIPHPEMLKRAFVLVPLAEIEPDLKLAGGVSAAEYAKQVSGQDLRKIGDLSG